MFNVYILDKYHAIGQFADKDGNLSWQMIITDHPIINNTIFGGFRFNEIDPNCFEFNGRKCSLKIAE